MNDIQWLKAYKTSRKKAQTLLIEKYGGYVYAIVLDKLRSTCNSEDIEDCVSDVFVELFTNIDKFDSSKGNLKGYIAIIAKRTAINAFNKGTYRRNTTLSTNDEETILPASEERTDENVQKKLFHQRL